MDNELSWKLEHVFISELDKTTTLLTFSTISILEEVKEWAQTHVEGYNRFLNANIILHSIIDSIIGFTPNIPSIINNIFVVDITRYFESIPMLGHDTLYEAMEFITSLGVSNMKNKSSKSE